MPVNISIVETDSILLSILSKAIDSSPEFKCVGSYSTLDTALREMAVNNAHETPDVVLIRMNLNSQLSVRYVRQLKQLLPRAHIIIMAFYLNTEYVFNALAFGASGCLLLRMPLPELMESIHDIHAGNLSLDSLNARKLLQLFKKGEPAGRPAEPLTQQALAVLKLLAQGYDCQEAARKLELPSLAVHACVRDIYDKLHFYASAQEIVKDSAWFTSSMKTMFFFWFLLLVPGASTVCWAQPQATVSATQVITEARADSLVSVAVTDPKAPLHVTPMHTPHPEVFSGISGPGHPVVGDGHGGYRTGREGTMYHGTEPAKPGWLDLGDRARGTAVRNGLVPPLRPLWEVHLRDTIINQGGDGFYYMTGSSGDNIWDVTSGIELWRSKDLQQWDYLGLVWSFVKDATWEKSARYVWAPEIHYIGGNYYFAYCVSGGTGGGTGILKSSTGKPEGPYVYALASGTRIGGGIDATLFEDDDGSVYFTSGGAGSIRKMLPDLSGFDGPAHSIQYERPADGGWTRNNIAQEGASLFKHNGIYYLGGAGFYQGRYSSLVAMSTNIFGPYKNWQEAVPCGGGGNYFQGADGLWYCTCFGNDDQSPWREKPGMMRIDFGADGRIKIADEQPTFVLQKGALTRWRAVTNATGTAPANELK